MPFLSAETCGAAHKPTQIMLKNVFLTIGKLARKDLAGWSEAAGASTTVAGGCKFSSSWRTVTFILLTEINQLKEINQLTDEWNRLTG